MDIRKLKERIADLMRKARDKAATESEAMSALSMAQKLAEKYGVTLDDCERDDLEFVQTEVTSNDGKRYLHEVDSMLGVAIGNFCDVKPWRNGGTLYTLGLEADVELANFIRERMKATMEYEWFIYKEYVHEGPIERGVRKSFMLGFADRVTARMKEVKATTAHYNRDSKALVVRKEGLIAAELERRGINLGSARRGRGTTAFDESAYASGQASGNAANIGRGVASNAGLLT